VRGRGRLRQKDFEGCSKRVKEPSAGDVEEEGKGGINLSLMTWKRLPRVYVLKDGKADGCQEGDENPTM